MSKEGPSFFLFKFPLPLTHAVVVVAYHLFFLLLLLYLRPMTAVLLLAGENINVKKFKYLTFLLSFL